MALSNDIRHYEDIRPHFDRALDSPRGIRITCGSYGEAINLRHRLYKLRVLDREQSLTLYEVGDERRHKSPYDLLKISIDGCEMRIVHAQPLIVEEL